MEDGKNTGAISVIRGLITETKRKAESGKAETIHKDKHPCNPCHPRSNIAGHAPIEGITIPGFSSNAHILQSCCLPLAV